MNIEFIALESLYVPDSYIDIGTDGLKIPHKEASDEVFKEVQKEAMNFDGIAIAIVEEGGQKYFVSKPVPNNEESRLVLFNAGVTIQGNGGNKVVVYNKAKSPISNYKWSRDVVYTKGGYV